MPPERLSVEHTQVELAEAHRCRARAGLHEASNAAVGISAINVAAVAITAVLGATGIL